MNAITKGYQDVPMTRRRAQLLAEYADKLAEMLENAPDDQDLAEWVQSKIDRAAGAIQSAYHYLDQEDDEERDDLEKARTKKYDYRRPSKRVNKRTGRREWDYFYAKKHGAKVSEGAFVEGAAFRLTWKGRRGHFHIDRVEGDQVFITHDSRPNMEPVAISKSELRALLKRQHAKAEQEHLDKKRRDVERIKSRNVKRGLGLALHRLRQAATQAGVELDERYQRKPKKKKTTETAREDRFDTMPEVESAEDLRAEFKRKIEANEGDYRLYVELFNVANYSETLANVPDSELFEHPITQELFSLTGAYPNDPVYIYLALQELPKEYTKRLFTELLRRYKETGERSISEGASVGIMQAHQHHFEQSTAPTAPPPIEEKDHPLLGLKTLDLDPQQVRSSYRNISHTPGKRAESERREWSETLDQLEAQAESEIQAGAKREEVEKRYQKLARRLLRTKLNVISARAQTASSAITGAGQFNVRQAQKRQQVLESREAQYRQALQEIKDTQPPTPSPAREQLTETVRELSDQPARTAAVSSTPRASEATLTGSGDLSDTERRDLTNRARFITSGSEETTKTGRRSRAQKAKDQELLLIYNRLHSDASARLGPLAPRFADYSQFVKLQGGDLPERAQTRADFRTGIMSSIEELRNATTAQPTSSTQKSANHLIDYRAQLLQTIERIA